jgi:hypothetical protein
MFARGAVTATTACCASSAGLARYHGARRGRALMGSRPSGGDTDGATEQPDGDPDGDIALLEPITRG